MKNLFVLVNNRVHFFLLQKLTADGVRGNHGSRVQSHAASEFKDVIGHVRILRHNISETIVLGTALTIDYVFPVTVEVSYDKCMFLC